MRTEQEVNEVLEYLRGNVRGSIYAYLEDCLKWTLGEDVEFLGTDNVKESLRSVVR